MTNLTVGKLREILAALPDDLEIIQNKYSDYQQLTTDDLRIIEAVFTPAYVMRPHPTMAEHHVKNIKQYLIIEQ